MTYSPYNLDAAASQQKSGAKRIVLIVLASVGGFALLAGFLALVLALPSNLNARRAANESSAVSTIRTLATAEQTYRVIHGTYGTAEELVAEGLIDPNMSGHTFEKTGYVFKVTVTHNANGLPQFIVEATPITASGLWATGTRTFHFDSDDHSIRIDGRGSASANDQLLEH